MCAAAGDAKWGSRCGKPFRSSLKLNTGLPRDPAPPPLGACPEGRTAGTREGTHTPTFTAALFITAKGQTQPKATDSFWSSRPPVIQFAARPLPGPWPFRTLSPICLAPEASQPRWGPAARRGPQRHTEVTYGQVRALRTVLTGCPRRPGPWAKGAPDKVLFRL